MEGHNVLVLSGGGPRGVVTLGILEYLEQINELKKYRVIVGTNIGSVIAVLLACRFKPFEILEKLFRYRSLYNFKSNFSLSTLTKGGLHSISSFLKPVEDIISLKLGDIPTLKQIHDKGYDIYLATANLSNSELEYISYETYPNLRCTDALKLSCSVPFYFERTPFKTCKYADASIYSTFPILYPSQRFSRDEINEIFGIDTSGSCIPKREKEEDSFIAHSQAMAHFVPIQTKKNDISTARDIYEDKLKLIEFPQLTISSVFNMYLDPSDVDKMFSFGFENVKKVIGIYPSDIKEIEDTELPEPVFPEEEVRSRPSSASSKKVKSKKVKSAA